MMMRTTAIDAHIRKSTTVWMWPDTFLDFLPNASLLNFVLLIFVIIL